MEDSEAEKDAEAGDTVRNPQVAIRSFYTAIDGSENIDKVIDIDQSPIGRTPRSNPGTYI